MEMTKLNRILAVSGIEIALDYAISCYPNADEDDKERLQDLIRIYHIRERAARDADAVFGFNSRESTIFQWEAEETWDDIYNLIVDFLT